MFISPQSSRDPAWLRQVLHSNRHLVPWRHRGRDDWRETPFPGLVTISSHFSQRILYRETLRSTSCSRFSAFSAPQTNRYYVGVTFSNLWFLSIPDVKVSIKMPHNITYNLIIVLAGSDSAAWLQAHLPAMERTSLGGYYQECEIKTLIFQIKQTSYFSSSTHESEIIFGARRSPQPPSTCSPSAWGTLSCCESLEMLNYNSKRNIAR